jgi:hypothetical protein
MLPVRQLARDAVALPEPIKRGALSLFLLPRRHTQIAASHVLQKLKLFGRVRGGYRRTLSATMPGKNQHGQNNEDDYPFLAGCVYAHGR